VAGVVELLCSVETVYSFKNKTMKYYVVLELWNSMGSSPLK
jgi:hypothetical protein